MGNTKLNNCFTVFFSIKFLNMKNSEILLKKPNKNIFSSTKFHNMENIYHFTLIHLPILKKLKKIKLTRLVKYQMAIFK